MSDQDLQPFAGHYTAEEGRFEVTIEVADDKLKLDMPGSRVLFAIPVGGHRFRVPEGSEAYLIFTLDGDQVTELAVEQDGAVTMKLTRPKRGP